MSKDSETPPPPGGQFLVYQTQDGKLKIDVRFEDETVWLTQQHMAELFQTTKQNVSLHIQNIYEERELERGATVKESLTVQREGSRSVQRRVEFYNLDVIISVGYRVKSAVATRFRIWATRLLREYIVKGFVLDDERLKNPDQPFDYFDELMRRISAESAKAKAEPDDEPLPGVPGWPAARSGFRFRAGHEGFEETAETEETQAAETMMHSFDIRDLAFGISPARRLAVMNLALRGIEADFGPEHADTFRRDLHPDVRADYVLVNPRYGLQALAR